MIHSARSAYAIFGSEPRDSPPWLCRFTAIPLTLSAGGTLRNTCLVLAALAALSRRAAIGADAEGSFKRTLRWTLTSRQGREVLRCATHRARCRGSRDNAQRRARYRIAPAYPAERKGHPLGRMDGGSRDTPARVHRLCVDRACQDPAVRANTGSGHVNVESVHGPVTRRDRLGFRYHLENQRRGSRTHRLGTWSWMISKAAWMLTPAAARTRATGIHGRICGRHRVGVVHVEQTGSGDIRSHTGSAGVTVRTPPRRTSSCARTPVPGSMTVERPMTAQGTITKHELMAQVGGGGRAIVDVRTGPGSIRID